MSEIQVGVREFKAHLSEYLRLVQHGHTVILTYYGRPVGQLSPVDQILEERVQALQEAGLVAWNGQKLKAITPPATYRGEVQVSDLVIEMRE